MEATHLQTFVSVIGTQKEPVRNFRLLGVGMRDTALSYLDNHSMPSGGDWGLGRIAAVFIRGAVDTTLDSLHMEKLDGNAVTINGYARGTVIQNSLFHEIGDNIIAQLGETTGAGPIAVGMGPDGTDGNQPWGTIIKSNFAYRCGLFEKQSSFYFQAKSAQSTIQDNIFFHGPRAGMNFNDGFGGGSKVIGNLMFSTVMESGDHGPFNSWDRQVWTWLDDDGKETLLKQYDEIANNFFIGNYYGQEAVDNDDGSAYYETHHNFFAYAGTGMKNDFNGHDNHHHDNLYGYIGIGMGICGNLPGHEDKFYNNKVIQMGDGKRYEPRSHRRLVNPGGHADRCATNPSMTSAAILTLAPFSVVTASQAPFSVSPRGQQQGSLFYADVRAQFRIRRHYRYYFDCTCFTAAGKDNCPQVHDNTIYTPDGTTDQVCGKTLAELQAEGFDLGTAIAKWPVTPLSRRPPPSRPLRIFGNHEDADGVHRPPAWGRCTPISVLSSW